MDPACLQYRLTDDERTAFERDGYFVVPNVLTREHVAQLTDALDPLHEHYRRERNLAPDEPLNLLDFMGKHDIFLELIDWPLTFTKVWEILGWHIQLYHSHTIITPPLKSPDSEHHHLNWHQDSGRLGIDLGGHPHPRVSLKVAFYLTDTTEVGRGNFYAIPGSHLQVELPAPRPGEPHPEGTIPIPIAAGDAVFFDRRLWHASSPNYSDVTRKVLFYGYSYRWLRPRDNMTIDHYLDRCGPIRRQLLGASTGGYGYTSPSDEDVPLREWIRQHVGEEAIIP